MPGDEMAISMPPRVGGALRARGASAGGEGNQELRRACREFEGIFIGMLMKEMGESVKGTGLFGNELSGEIYSDMFTSGMADAIARGGGFGLSDMLYESLVGKVRSSEGGGTVEHPAEEAGGAPKTIRKVRFDGGDRHPLARTGPTSGGDTIDHSILENLRRYGREIERAAREYGLDANLLRAMIAQESGGNPRAVSGKGAKGLMQIMDSTARELGVENVFDPGANIQAGAAYIRSLLDRFDGDVVLSLAAYNAGPTSVEKYGGVPPFEETREFVLNVFRNMRSFRGRRW